MIQHELEDVYKKCRTRPQFFSLRLAERLFGLDVMMKSTPNGIGGKAALNPTILDAIKSNYLYLNPLSPKSDSHETSPHNIPYIIQQTSDENIQTHQVEAAILI